MLGRTLNRFRIESAIGEGGMGVVYKARDSRLESDRRGQGAAAGRRRRSRAQAPLRREAQAAWALNHPGIVTVHDVGVGSRRPTTS